ncbi:MAG: tetratricopeptide repeat protein [Gammaproteobacteria bacterium]|nr:tetratricopeptide repeat protein [Gammaproteobacteria bacterium]MBV9621371.1 tetratricopeptide repeat protein [Gammaproteobacteria bacterium]
MEEYLSEKEQWEWLKAQVRENALAVLGAVVVVVAGLAGWRWWQQHQDAARLAAGGKYIGMVQSLERGDRSQALVLLGELERDAPGSPYTDQAKLLAARVYVDGNELDKAARELAAVAMNSKDHELGLIARLRLARVQIAQRQPDAALSTLKESAPASFAARFHEVRGDAYFAKGDRAAALREYREAKSAPEAGAAPLLDLKIADLAADSAPPTAAGK